LQLQAGQTVLLQGPSGCGKSTLMRAVAGIWPWQEGAITPSPDWMFLPQKPYLPQGSLRQALTYPGLLGEVPDATLQEALAQAHLPHLIDRLDDEQAWDQCLSGGEQQRLALARTLVRRPRWVFADEVTSALDEATQAALYRALRAMVLDQRGGLISITHQPALWPLHNTVWQVTPGSDSAAVPQVRVMPT
jgi:vitamin B12/bleomycin/antimicrobial peptide transport system ATP-binding/permease protein